MYRIRPLGPQGVDSGTRTRHSLIKAATPLFAKRGFDAASSRDIADKAKANVSAINYHFGSKMGLYLAVLKSQSEQMDTNYPLDNETLRQEPPAVRLRFLVGNLLRRIFLNHDPDQTLSRLMGREISNPTEALEVVANDIIRNQLDYIRALLNEILARPLAPAELDRFVVSVVGQCFYYQLAAPLLQQLDISVPATEADMETLADHITRFSLAGLGA